MHLSLQHPFSNMTRKHIGMSLTVAINKEYSSKEQILEEISSQEEFGLI